MEVHFSTDLREGELVIGKTRVTRQLHIFVRNSQGSQVMYRHLLGVLNRKGLLSAGLSRTSPAAFSYRGPDDKLDTRQTHSFRLAEQPFLDSSWPPLDVSKMLLGSRGLLHHNRRSYKVLDEKSTTRQRWCLLALHIPINVHLSTCITVWNGESFHDPNRCIHHWNEYLFQYKWKNGVGVGWERWTWKLS